MRNRGLSRRARECLFPLLPAAVSAAALPASAADTFWRRDPNITGDGFDGTVNVNGGVLAVLMKDPWRLDGTMNLTETRDEPALVEGSRMVVIGTINVSGEAAIASDADFIITSAVNLPAAPDVLTLDGATRYAGGAVGGVADLGGVLELDGGPGFHPKYGEKFVILTAGRLTGRFDLVTGFELGDKLWLGLLYCERDVTVLAGLPGDADMNGRVDFLDYLTVKRNLGGPARVGWPDGDFNGDGSVGRWDFQALATYFGCSVSGPKSVVPEPATLLLLALGGALTMLRRRRRQARPSGPLIGEEVQAGGRRGRHARKPPRPGRPGDGTREVRSASRCRSGKVKAGVGARGVETV